MNTQIVKLFGLIIVLYATLLGFTSYWSVFEAKGLKQNPANRRPLLQEQRIHRGEILATDGSVIARSDPVGRGSNQIYIRHYPQGGLFGNAVGYSFVNRSRVGIEESHNDELVGNKTEFLSILDQLSGHRRQGDNVQSALDPNAQRIASQALAGQRGAVVAMEPGTGKVRVMVSNPTYDPNLVQDDKTFSRLNSASGSPLFNRATQSGYPPGSTMKVVTATAALDTGQFSPTSVINGNSPKTISGVPLQNFGHQSFGDVDLTKALTHSVNTVWAQVGEKLGKDTLYRYMDRFGFDAKPPLDYPPLQLATSGVYDRGNLLSASNSIDIGRVAIGQERLKVTPLQMAEVVSAVANGGVLVKPRLWEKVIDQDGRVTDMSPEPVDRVMSQDTAGKLTKMMTDVVNEGTGGAAALGTDQVAGKTGTAQLSPTTNLNDAWFIGFAPAKAPKVAVAAVVENVTGEGGTVAAPIARQVLESLLGKSRHG